MVDRREPLSIHSQPSTINLSPPVALTIAGSDSSAGAGLQADLKTFQALGVYGLSAATCVVAEVPGKVTRIAAIDPAMVGEQIELLLASFPVGAIKTGLLCSSEIVEIVAGILRQTTGKIPLVIDPVMVATSGAPLLETAAIEAYRTRLFPLATVITPNMAEAAALTGRPVRTLEEMHLAVRRMQSDYGTQIVLKGGHLGGRAAIDLFFDGGAITEFSAPFIGGVATHGTGCAYSAAIAAGLAESAPLPEAIARAKEFVSRAIEGHFTWGAVQALNHPLGVR